MAPLPPELTWLRGRRVLGQVHPTEPPLWAQTKAQRKVCLPTLLPRGLFGGVSISGATKIGARDKVTRFRVAAAPPGALILQEKLSAPWEAPGVALGELRPLPLLPPPAGTAFISGG